jgi:hypothetical protein
MREVVPVVTIVMIFGIPVVVMLGHYCHAAWKAWLDVGLKRDMIARGYTAEEIIAVLAADSGSRATTSLPDVPPAKPIKQPVYSP